MYPMVFFLLFSLQESSESGQHLDQLRREIEIPGCRLFGIAMNKRNSLQHLKQAQDPMTLIDGISRRLIQLNLALVAKISISDV